MAKFYQPHFVANSRLWRWKIVEMRSRQLPHLTEYHGKAANFELSLQMRKKIKATVLAVEKLAIGRETAKHLLATRRDATTVAKLVIWLESARTHREVVAGVTIEIGAVETVSLIVAIEIGPPFGTLEMVPEMVHEMVREIYEMVREMVYEMVREMVLGMDRIVTVTLKAMGIAMITAVTSTDP